MLWDSDIVLGDIGTPVTTLFFLRGGGNETVGTACSLQEAHWSACAKPGASFAGGPWLSLGIRKRLSNSRRACRFGDMTRLAGGGSCSVSVMTFVPVPPMTGMERFLWKRSKDRE